MSVSQFDEDSHIKQGSKKSAQYWGDTLRTHSIIIILKRGPLYILISEEVKISIVSFLFIVICVLSFPPTPIRERTRNTGPALDGPMWLCPRPRRLARYLFNAGRIRSGRSALPGHLAATGSHRSKGLHLHLDTMNFPGAPPNCGGMRVKAIPPPAVFFRPLNFH